MKCLYPKPCESRKPDKTCGASILGYCDYAEKPTEPPQPVEVHKIDPYVVRSQDEYIQETIRLEKAGHHGTV
jgi:hypothetical protein